MPTKWLVILLSLIEAIEINPFQPRSNFNEESLKELATSIKELGYTTHYR
jgi:ParB-like chromosome segregation protein Spo0J